MDDLYRAEGGRIRIFSPLPSLRSGVVHYPRMISPEYEQRMAEMQDAFVWETPAYERHERGPRWYIVMSVVALLLVGYAVWTSNFLFAFLILLAAIILILAGNEHPPTVLAQVGHNGIVWNGDYLPFDRVGHFAIIYQPPEVRVLYIQPRSAILPRLRIPLGDQDPLTLRNHLKQYVTEDLALKDEHASDMIARIFRL